MHSSSASAASAADSWSSVWRPVTPAQALQGADDTQMQPVEGTVQPPSAVSFSVPSVASASALRPTLWQGSRAFNVADTDTAESEEASAATDRRASGGAGSNSPAPAAGRRR